MDTHQFDRWTVAMTQRPSRRLALRILTGVLFGGLLAHHQPGPAVAQERPPLVDALPPLQIEPADSCVYMGLTSCYGSCIDIETDVNNCGGCGLSCSPPAGASSTCADRKCGITCNANRGDCNGDTKDGCESDLQTDNANCGSCNVACQNGAKCVAGKCM